MGGIQFGVLDVLLEPPAVFARNACEIERLGYDFLWAADTVLHGWDTFACLALAAAHTETIGLGTNLVHPYSRHPAVNLQGIITVDHLSKGRAHYGIGVGSSWYLREIGLPMARLEIVRDMIVQSRRFVAGEAVTFEGPGFRLHDARLRNRFRDRLPIYVAGSAPRALALGAELADGVFAHVGAAPEIAETAARFVDERARAAGRGGTVDFSLFAYCSLGPDLASCVADCRSATVNPIVRFPEAARAVGMPDSLVAQVRHLYRTASVMEAGELVPDDVVSRMTLVGPADRVRRQVEDLVNIGIRHVTILPRGHTLGGRDRMQDVRQFAEHVIPHFR